MRVPSYGRLRMWGVLLSVCAVGSAAVIVSSASADPPSVAATVTDVPVGQVLPAVATADSKGDVPPDLVSVDAATGEVIVDGNGGDGSFAPTPLASCAGLDLAVGDVNGDALPDIAVAWGDQQSVDLFVQK